MSKKISTVLAYGNIAPFHMSRLLYAQKYLSTYNIQLHVIQIAGKQTDYQWAPVSTLPNQRLSLHTLFPTYDYISLSPQKIAEKMASTLATLKPDVAVVNGWGPKESSYLLQYALKHSIKRILISDSQYKDKPRNNIQELYKSWFTTTFHAYFVGGGPHIRYLQKLGCDPTRCFIGCDVVDNGFFSPTPKPFHPSSPQCINMLSCIRMIPEKNILQTLHTLSQTSLPWKWTIAGNGILYHDIVQTVQKLGLQDKVTLVGHIQYNNLPELYQKHALYFQPSVSEPWGLAVNEAMASGKPVLASLQCGCASDLISQETGWLFNAYEPHSLLKTLQTVWNMREQWFSMGQQAMSHIQPWSVHLFAEQLKLSIEKALFTTYPQPFSDMLDHAFLRCSTLLKNRLLFHPTPAPNPPLDTNPTHP